MLRLPKPGRAARYASRVRSCAVFAAWRALAASGAAPGRRGAETGFELAKCKGAAAQRGMVAAVTAISPSMLYVLLSRALCSFALPAQVARSSPCADVMQQQSAGAILGLSAVRRKRL